MDAVTPADIAADLGRRLSHALGIEVRPSGADHAPPLRCWAACGAMALTGDADGPPLAPAAPIAAVAGGAGLVLDALAPGVLDDAPALLGERAALSGFRRQGRVSCGGATRLLPTGDGWLAVTLARDDDWQLLPAWLGEDVSTWDGVARRVASMPAAEAVGGAALLGIPASAVRRGARRAATPWRVHRVGATAAPRTEDAPLVVDMSALWAGPLCTDLLRRAGAQVIKVEAHTRPDGARRGPRAFFDLLNAGKRSVALDLNDDAVRVLLAAADVVVTSARQRAFAQLGIDPAEVLRASPTVWVAITAHGWDVDRVGFGDDVAAGAGLVAWHPRDGEPRFAGDAIADPMCGLLAATAALAALEAGGSWFVDAPLAGAAGYAADGAAGAASEAELASGRLWSAGGELVATPRARGVTAPSRELGADTESVLASLGVARLS